MLLFPWTGCCSWWRGCVTWVRVRASGWPQRKRIYIIRHGESVWNEAQEGLLHGEKSESDEHARHFSVGNALKSAGGMLSDVDHPLNATGRVQAERLAEAVRGLQQARGGGAADDEAAALLDAELVLCSPLTRAVQTCLIGLAPMLRGAAAYKSPRRSLPRSPRSSATPRAGARPVVLNPNVRERRNRAAASTRAASGWTSRSRRACACR